MPATLTLTSHNVALGSGSGLAVRPATVTINGTTIRAVTEGHDPGADFDLGRKLLTPALINAHTHIAMSAYRGLGGEMAMAGNVVEDLYFRLESSLQPGDVRALARMGAWECLRSGTGTIWEHYYGGAELVSALKDVGLGGVVACTLQDLDGPGQAELESALDQTLAIHSDAALRDEGIVAALGPHATDTVSPELWARIAALSQKHQLPVHAHLAQHFDEYRRAWARHGCSPVTMLQRQGVLDAGPSRLLVHGLFLSDDDLAVLASTGSTLGYCPASQAQYAFPANIASWRAAGVNLVLGTDAGACNDTMNLQAELRLLAVAGGSATTHGSAHTRFRQAGDLAAAEAVSDARNNSFQPVSPTDVLAAVLGTPGALHPRLDVGHIAVGSRADLVAWDLDHPSLWPGRHPLQSLVLGDAAPAIWGMLRGGAWVGTPGDFHRSLLAGETYVAHRTEADARLTALLQRAGLT